jgi:hypothetical protein
MAAELFVIEAQESTALDTSKIILLRQSLGDQRCREVVEEVMFHLADRMRMIEEAMRNKEHAQVIVLAARLAGLSEQVGLTDYSRVARDLRKCVEAEDWIAAGAVGARLVRLGEESLYSVMVYADQSAL